MNRFTKLAIAGALLIAPTSAFAGFNGDESAFFERDQLKIERSGDTVAIVAGSFESRKGVAVGKPGYLFNRADRNNDGVLDAAEQRRFKSLKLHNELGE